MRLQQSAELASERAIRIHNVTVSIRDALDEAQKAQDEAKEILDSIRENIEKTK